MNGDSRRISVLTGVLTGASSKIGALIVEAKSWPEEAKASPVSPAVGSVAPAPTKVPVPVF